jgi:ssDNA-binding Zn-finger/Zn-ribbon topoisomerase 1
MFVCQKHFDFIKQCEESELQVRCPYCGSSEVIFVPEILDIGAFGMKVDAAHYRCKNDHTWNQEAEAPHTICPLCQSTFIEEHHEEVDIGVGTQKGPSSYKCAQGHVWSDNDFLDKIIEVK